MAADRDERGRGRAKPSVAREAEVASTPNPIATARQTWPRSMSHFPDPEPGDRPDLHDRPEYRPRPRRVAGEHCQTSLARNWLYSFSVIVPAAFSLPSFSISSATL